MYVLEISKPKNLTLGNQTTPMRWRQGIACFENPCYLSQWDALNLANFNEFLGAKSTSVTNLNLLGV